MTPVVPRGKSSLPFWLRPAEETFDVFGKVERDVAVLVAPAVTRPSASTGSDVAPRHYPGVPQSSRFLERRIELQAEIGRRACRERVAKPAPQ
jgi:hypothetical protein